MGYAQTRVHSLRRKFWCVPISSDRTFQSSRVMELENNQFCYKFDLQAPKSAKTFTYRLYVRTNDKDIRYATRVSVVALAESSFFNL